MFVRYYLRGGKLTICTQFIDESTRNAISRLTNAINILVSHFLPLTDVILLEAYDWIVDHEYQPKDLMQEEVGDALVAAMRVHG